MMEVYTEKVRVFCHEEDGWVVEHVFRDTEDGRRCTQFYQVLAERHARVLARALEASIREWPGLSVREANDTAQ